MLARFRREPLFQYSNPWVGKPIDYNLVLPDEALKAKTIGAIYECALWFFEFHRICDESNVWSQYFGVMDIDIDKPKDISDEDYKKKKAAYLPELVDLLTKMGYHSYRIYASGIKGYHVFLHDLKFWRVPEVICPSTHNLWIEQQLRCLFPLLYDKLDMNIYHIGKGIRNPLFPHPKTGQPSTLIVEKNSPPCMWYWISDNFDISIPRRIAFDRSLIPPRPVPPPTAGGHIPQLGNGECRIVRYKGRLMDELKRIYSGSPITRRGETNLYLIDSKHCPIKGGDHKSKGKNYIKAYDKEAIIKCHSSSCSGKSLKFVEKQIPLTDFEYLLSTIREKQKIPVNVKATRIIDPDKQKHVLPADISWSLSDGFGIISAPMGAGKTTSVIKWIEETRLEKHKSRQERGKEPKKFRVLLVVTRITQAINFGTKYPGMKSYLDVEGSVADNESSVLCVNSLSRVLPTNTYALPRFDLLILDEIESIIEALVSVILSQSAKSRQCNIWQLFKCLIIGSKRVLFMDGILTERTALYLHALKVLERCNLVQHEGQPDYREYVSFRSITSFEEDFDKSCAEGKKLAIVSNSKSALYSFSSRATTPGSKLVITGDSTREQKLTASDPNEQWSTDILGFNTAVGPGASFDEEHFDIMYVICSPLSCTPYVLYQLINRIRNLKEKTVKIFIMYNENKNIPTREEMKNKKAQNIIKMHGKQDEFSFPVGFFEKVGSDYVRLDINTADFNVIRKLIEEQKLVLYYEDSHFVDTLVDYEIEKLKFSDTSYYSSVLFDCIKRNGGSVKGLVDYENLVDKEREYLKDSTRMIRKESVKNYKELALSSDNVLTQRLPKDISPAFKAYINKTCQLNEVTTQFMWNTLRRALTCSEMTLYEKELESINTQKKAINNTLIYSTGLLESFKELCSVCGFRICQARGIISGSGGYELFTDNHEKINQLILDIDSELYNSTKRRMSLHKLKETRMPRDTATFKNIKMLFSHFGIPLILSNSNRKKVVKGTSVRYFDKTFNPCLFTQYCRMAFSGLDLNTGLQSETPFAVLEEEYKKNSNQ